MLKQRTFIETPLPPLAIFGEIASLPGFSFSTDAQSAHVAQLQDKIIDDWEEWVKTFFPKVASAPFAPRHRRVWSYLQSIRAGEPPPPPLVEIWPRGGAKTTTIQLGVTYLGHRLQRRFGLYVSETQGQAREQVQTIGSLLEGIGVQKLTGAFGNQKGWRQDQLRTAHGFNVMGLGLDVAARGIKLDEFRPDFIIFDDIDGTEDTPEATAKKIRSITKKLLPAGAKNCAIICLQNLVIENGVFGQLYDGRADFLQNRICHKDVAVEGLKTEPRQGEDGRVRHFIIEGTPTWEGQNLEVCQRQIIEWGMTAFLEEAQHEVGIQKGYFFDESKFQVVESLDDLPPMVKVVRAWDYAGTQGGGDYTVGVLMGKSENGVIWILDVVRAQLSSDNVEKLVKLVADWDRENFGHRYTLRTPQDPGSAGKRVADQDKRDLGAVARPVTGKKALRAKRYAAAVNEGNARILKDGRPRTAEIDLFMAEMTRLTALEGKSQLWNRDFCQEHRKFREDEKHDFDDQVDAASDAFNELCSGVSWDW